MQNHQDIKSSELVRSAPSMKHKSPIFLPPLSYYDNNNIYNNDIVPPEEESVTTQSVFLTQAKPIIAEFVGTFILVLLGILCAASNVYLGTMHGIVQVASTWGFAIAISIYISMPHSGAHLNPCISFANAFFNSKLFLKKSKFTFKSCFFYTIAQFLGSLLAGWVNYTVFENFIIKFEKDNNITRGARGSELSASGFTCFFPSPNLFDHNKIADFDYLMTPASAFYIEAFGTGLLVLTVFALTDCCNKSITKGMEPFFIGFLITVVCAAVGPLTGASLNPARDLGPRIVTFILGWGEIAFPGPQKGFWIYIFGPYLGAIAGGGIYHALLKKPGAKCNCKVE